MKRLARLSPCFVAASLGASLSALQCGGASDTSGLLAPAGNGGSGGGAGSGVGIDASSSSGGGSGASSGATDGGASSDATAGTGRNGGGNGGGGKGGGAGSADAGGGGGSGGGGGGGGGSDAGTTKAAFRVAQLSPTTLAFDFCWQSQGGAWNGPVMQNLGVSGGLGYAQVSEYVHVDAVATTVRIVAPSATDCASSLGDVAFTPSPSTATLVAGTFGAGTTLLSLKTFADERDVGSSQTKLRAIHAALTSTGTGGGTGTTEPVDFYLSAAGVTPFTDVAFDATAPQGSGVDANGYTVRDAIASQTLDVLRYAQPQTTLLAVPSFSAAAQHVYSLFTVGIYGNASRPMQLLVCDDSAAPAGHLSSCTLL